MTKIMVVLIGRDGVSRKKRSVQVLGGKVDGRYVYRSDKVFYTEGLMCWGLLPFKIRMPTLMYQEDVIEPLGIKGTTDFNSRPIGKTAEEFGMMLEDGALAIYELLRKKNTNNENLMLAMLAGVLVINVALLFGMLS